MSEAKRTTGEQKYPGAVDGMKKHGASPNCG
jgi:hypothetical protein